MMIGKHAKARSSLAVASLLVLLLRGPGCRIEVSSFGAQVEDPMHIAGNRAKTHNGALVPDKVDGTNVGEQHATADINTTPTELIVNATAQDEFAPTLSVGESALVNIAVSAEKSSAEVRVACVMGKQTKVVCDCGQHQGCPIGNICIEYKDYKTGRADTYLCEDKGTSTKNWKEELFKPTLKAGDIWIMNQVIQDAPFTMFDGHVAFFALWYHFGQTPRGLKVKDIVTDKHGWQSWKYIDDPTRTQSYEPLKLKEDGKYGSDTAWSEYTKSSDLIHAQLSKNVESASYDLRKAFINSFLDSGYWEEVRASPTVKEAADANFDVLVAILDPLWDDKDDEEALMSIAHALQAGLIDFAYIYITGPACEARARLTLAFFRNVLKQTAEQQVVRIRWLPLRKCNTEAGKCSDTYNGVSFRTAVQTWAPWGKGGGEAMGYKCPSICGHAIENQLDKVLHQEWEKLLKGIPEGPWVQWYRRSEITMEGTHSPVNVYDEKDPWINYKKKKNEFDCDGDVNKGIVAYFQRDLKAAIDKLNTDKQTVKISVLSAAPLTGAAELLTALNSLLDEGRVTLIAVNFMGGFEQLGKKEDINPGYVDGNLFVLDSCSNWLFDVEGTKKVMRVLQNLYALRQVNFFGSAHSMKGQGNKEYGAYINAVLKKLEKGFVKIKPVAILFQIERFMFTTARQGENYKVDAIDMPNRCAWVLRLAGLAKGKSNEQQFLQLLEKINMAYFEECVALAQKLYSKKGAPPPQIRASAVKNAYFPVGELTGAQVLSWKPSKEGVVEFCNVGLSENEQYDFLASPDFKKEKIESHAYDYFVHVPDAALKQQLHKQIHPLMHKWANKVVSALEKKLSVQEQAKSQSITDTAGGDSELFKGITDSLGS